MDRGARLISIFRDDDSFARSQAVGFDDNGPFRTLDGSVSFGRRSTFNELGRWNVVRFKKPLRNALARLETGLIGRWTDHRKTMPEKYIDQTLAQRQFGPDKR